MSFCCAAIELRRETKEGRSLAMENKTLATRRSITWPQRWRHTALETFSTRPHIAHTPNLIGSLIQLSQIQINSSANLKFSKNFEFSKN